MDLENLMKNDSICKKVDDFIKNIHDKNIKLDPKAQTLMITEIKGKDSWGKPIKESLSLADRIGEEMAYYQRLVSAESFTEALVDDGINQKGSPQTAEEFIRHIDARSAVRNRKNEAANNLFHYIELAYTNNMVEEIGLGNKLKAIEQENSVLKERNMSLQKLNDQLVRDNNDLQKYFPDNKKSKRMAGEVFKP